LTECSDKNARSLSAAIAPSPAHGWLYKLQENPAPEESCQGISPVLTQYTASDIVSLADVGTPENRDEVDGLEAIRLSRVASG